MSASGVDLKSHVANAKLDVKLAVDNYHQLDVYYQNVTDSSACLTFFVSDSIRADELTQLAAERYKKLGIEVDEKANITAFPMTADGKINCAARICPNRIVRDGYRIGFMSNISKETYDANVQIIKQAQFADVKAAGAQRCPSPVAAAPAAAFFQHVRVDAGSVSSAPSQSSSATPVPGGS